MRRAQIPPGIAVASSAQALAILPTMLVATLATVLRSDLGFDETALGVAIALRSAASALCAAGLGRVSERIGPARALRTGAIGSAVTMAAIALTVQSVTALAVLLAVSGVCLALVQPATDLWIARVVPRAQQGMALGIKQAAVPGAGLLAGIAVPVVAGTVGWRWAFLAGAGAATLLALLVPMRPVTQVRRTGKLRGGDVSLAALLVLSLGVGLGSMSISAFSTFLVSSAVHSGLTAGQAGALFAVGSAMGILVRLLVGHAADVRDRSQLRVASLMLAIGALGFVMLAGGRWWMVVIATPLLFASAWGWPGLFFLAVVRTNANAPAAASSITATGAFVGSTVGPVAFGLLVTSDYRRAWLATSVVAACASVAMLVGRNLVRSELLRAGRLAAP